MAELVSFGGVLHKMEYTAVNIAKKDRNKKIDINKSCICDVKYIGEYKYTIKAIMEISFTPRALFKLRCTYDMEIGFDGKPTEQEFNENVKNYIRYGYREISLLMAVLTRTTYNDSIIEDPDGYDLVIRNFE